MFEKIKRIFFQEKKEAVQMTKELKEYLANIIIKAREEERQQTIEELHEEMEKTKNDMRDNFECELAEREAKIHGMTLRIKELELQVKNSQKAYKTFYKDMMATRRVATEIVHQVKRLFGYTGEIYQSFIGIKDTADLHFQNMVKDDEERRMLLSLEPLRTLNGGFVVEQDDDKIMKNLKDEIKIVAEIVSMDEHKFKKEVKFNDNISVGTTDENKKSLSNNNESYKKDKGKK